MRACVTGRPPRARGPGGSPPVAARRGRGTCARAGAKEVWLQTRTVEAATAALESGRVGTFLFDGAGAREELTSLGRVRAVTVSGDALVDDLGEALGEHWTLSGPGDLSALQARAEAGEVAAGATVVVDSTDWRVIPAENLIAAFQSLEGRKLLAVAHSAADAELMLDALEVGTAGVVLATEDPAEVRAALAALAEREARGSPASRLEYREARVTAVRPVGVGDRACVDFATLLTRSPGEGCLAGNFSRCLFLVRAESSESGYISSRPFRVNAGPVHSYVLAPGGRTAYLSELRCGSRVLVADERGGTREAVVGRVKVEARPLVLVEAETEDGASHSVLLQNAETVSLVGPGAASGAARAISVSDMEVGDLVYVHVTEGGRHTGIKVDEFVEER